MFGLSFLFSAALWLLPLAGLPILLHLLFRRKSPIIHFSTLRFIKSSLQRTAARKRIQRWLLLATRALLLALLIWAISQPAKKLAANWGAGQGSLGGVAAIVVDTGYSMELKEQEVTLLQRANNLVEDLLRGELKDSKVAIFRSLPNPTDKPEQLETASAILSQWTPLSPQPAPQPLSERVMAAMQLLKRQDATHKWLVVITDLQSKEFAHPVPLMDEGQLLLFDLHPDVPRDAGVTEVAVEPEQTIPGLASEGIVEVTGRSGDSRAVTLSLTAPDGKQLSASPPRMANFDAVGHGQVRFPVELPAERWLLMTGALQVDDSLAWDNTRSHLLEVPPRQVVTLFDAPSQPQAERFLRLALDFSEGKMPAWPIDLRKGRSFDGSINVAVVPVTQWPDENECASLRNFARAGGTIIFALQPGLEESWPKLTATQKKTLADLLPSEVGTESISGAYHATVGVANDPLLAGLTDDKFRLTSIIARRLVPLSSGGQGVTTILNAVPMESNPGAKTHGLLFRRNVGSGTVYTLATLPQALYTNLPTHPLFLPLMVKMALRPPGQSAAQNVQLGEPLVLAGPRFAGYEQLEVEGPKKDVYVVKVSNDEKGRRFVFDRAIEPGLYAWRKAGDAAILAMTNVQLPSSEAELVYRDADHVVPTSPNVLVARSLPEMQQLMNKVAEPEPKWSGPIAIVLFLLCLEALMGSISKLWKPISLRAFLPKLLSPS